MIRSLERSLVILLRFLPTLNPKVLDLNLLHCLPLFSGLLLPKDMGKLYCTSEKMRGLVLKGTFATSSSVAKDLIRLSEENNAVLLIVSDS